MKLNKLFLSICFLLIVSCNNENIVKRKTIVDTLQQVQKYWTPSSLKQTQLTLSITQTFIIGILQWIGMTALILIHFLLIE